MMNSRKEMMRRKVIWGEMKMMKCEDCGIENEDVKAGICPYAEEIHGEQIDVIPCSSCFRTRSDDI